MSDYRSKPRLELHSVCSNIELNNITQQLLVCEKIYLTLSKAKQIFNSLMGIYLHDSNTGFWVSIHDGINNGSSSPPSRQKTAMHIQDTSEIAQIIQQALTAKILNTFWCSYVICLHYLDCVLIHIQPQTLLNLDGHCHSSGKLKVYVPIVKWQKTLSL